MKFISFALPLFLLFSTCSNKEPVVAHVGNSRISLEEFKIAYLEIIKQPNVYDSPELREQFLNEMVDRLLLAKEAEKMGLAADERLQYRVHAQRDKNLRDAHYQKVIKPRIVINETDVERAYAYMNEERRIRHLFSPRRSAADTLYRFLLQGALWEDLARSVFADARLAENGGDLGWVAWEQMEYDLAMTAYSLPLRQYSTPVASSYGWHILQVVDWRKTPLLSQTDYELLRRNARGALELKLGDRAALAYIAELMKNKKIKIYPKGLAAVGQQLGAILKRNPSTTDQFRQEQLSEAETGRMEASLWQLRTEPLATIDDEKMTIGEFIAALNYVPYHAAHQSMKTALDFVLRDRALTREARSLGLERDAVVRIKTSLFARNRLQMARRSGLLANVKAEENDLRAFFDAHLHEKYPNLKFEDVRESLLGDVLAEKRAQILRDHLRALRDNMGVRLNPAPIHAWYDGLLKK